MMKFFALFILALIGLLSYLFIGLFSRAYAQGLNYPIKELGYCRDAKECYLYCEIPKNTPACWSYGKFKLGERVLAETSESPEEKARRLGIVFPIAELGNCANVSACMNYCNGEQNHQACLDFAKKKGLHKEGEKNERLETRIDKNKFLEDANRELGCDSYDSCRSFCENPNNQQKCMDFAKQHRLHEERQGYQLPQGQEKPRCDSEESCRKYCQEHPTDCPGYSSGQTGGSTGSYLGPTGCKTEEECRTFCQANPDQCPGFQQAQPTSYPQPTYQSYPTPPTDGYPQPTFTQPQSYPTYTPQTNPESGSSGTYQQYPSPTQP